MVPEVRQRRDAFVKGLEAISQFPVKYDVVEQPIDWKNCATEALDRSHWAMPLAQIWAVFADAKRDKCRISLRAGIETRAHLESTRKRALHCVTKTWGPSPSFIIFVIVSSELLPTYSAEEPRIEAVDDDHSVFDQIPIYHIRPVVHEDSSCPSVHHKCTAGRFALLYEPRLPWFHTQPPLCHLVFRRESLDSVSQAI
jgi:hypothetical protein